MKSGGRGNAERIKKKLLAKYKSEIVTKIIDQWKLEVSGFPKTPILAKKNFGKIRN